MCIPTMYFEQGQMQHSIKCSQVTHGQQYSAAPHGPREASAAVFGLRLETHLPLKVWQKHFSNCNAFIHQA